MIFDLTEKGIEKWECFYCRREVIIDKGQDKFACPGGCPGRWNFLGDVYRNGELIKPE